MRLAPIPPSDLDPALRRLHNDMAASVAEFLHGFVSRRDDGALVGPFPPLLHFPEWGGPAWTLTKSLMEHSTLPAPAREVAVLVVGAAFGSRYELYAHEQVAQRSGLAPDKIATITAGQRPAGLDAEEAAAYDVAAALTRGAGPLPESTYRRAVEVFGQHETAELVYLVGGYCLVSVLLNAYDLSVPGREEGLPEG